MNNDRHENKNWKFAGIRDTSRIYRNRQNGDLYKSVAKRTGSSSNHQWEHVGYTNAGLKNRFGKLTWVATVADLSTLAQRVEEQEAIYAQLEASGATWTAEAYQS